MDVDELFKKSGHQAPGKRKLDPIKDPNEIYKSAKLSYGASRHAQVQDDDDDTEAGPAPPPDDDDNDPNGDYGPFMPPDEEPDNNDDDEEGRFFGGGITKQESQILDFVESASTAPLQINIPWLRKTAIALEKSITKNAEMRAKFHDQPVKFIASEADLDAQIKTLSMLTQNVELYAEFIRLGCGESLVGLLAHENTDIAIDVIEVIEELTDEDVITNDVVDGFIECGLLSLLASNLSRLDENDENDRNGVYHILGILDNLSSYAQKTSTTTIFTLDKDILSWLLTRINKPEQPPSQNKQYAAEVLSIITSSSNNNKISKILITELNAIDSLLQLIAPYRKHTPTKSSPEEEYMLHLFGALTSLVDSSSGKDKFLDAEGVELCVIMLKEWKNRTTPVLRLLEHAMTPMDNKDHDAAARVCIKFVEAGGLKPVFTLFAKASSDGSSKSSSSSSSGVSFTVLFKSMLRMLPAESPSRIRTLAKFVEKNYDKIVRLFTLRRKYMPAINKAATEVMNQQHSSEQEEEEDKDKDLLLMEAKWSAGLYNLQCIDVILAWLVAEDNGAKRKIRELLADTGEDLGSVRATLEEQMGELDEGEDEGRDMKDMLGTLVEFLQ